MHGADAKPSLTRHLANADSGVVVGWFCGGISEDRYDWCLSDELRESCEGTAHRTDHSCCAGQSKERPAHIQSLGKSYGRCGGSSASRSPSRPSSSPRSGARPSPRLALRGWWSGQGVEAKLAFKAHPHMLRHACGYALANKGHATRALQAYLGHKNIQHTVRYTELSPARFRNFWRE